MPNKARNLLDNKFMLGYLRAKVLPLYSQFSSIENIEIISHKELIWPGTAYHVVIEYKTIFKDIKGNETILPIFCSAHWEEPRINVYTSLRYLWDHGFNEPSLAIPHPLFYSRQFRGIFYEGIEGRNLYRFIRESDIGEVEKIIPKAAKWFAKLHHQTSVKTAKNFNKQNSRIKTVRRYRPPAGRRCGVRCQENQNNNYSFRPLFVIVLNIRQVHPVGLPRRRQHPAG